MHGARGGRPVVHARYSKFLPKNLAGRYRQLLKDGSLLEGKEHLALLETLLVERLERLGDGDAHAALWALATEQLGTVREQMALGDPAGLMKALAALDDTMRNGLDMVEAESSARQLIQESAKVRAVEVRLEYNQQTALSAREAQAFAAAVMHSVNTRVSNESEKRAIAEDIARLNL